MSNEPKFLISMPKNKFDDCFDVDTQQELQILVEFIGGVPLREEYNHEWIFKNIKEAEGCITGWGSLPLDDSILTEAKNLKIIFHSAGGVRGILKSTRKDIRIVNNVAINAIPVAEFTLGLILSSLKGVYYYNEQIHKLGKAGWGKKDTSISPGYYGTKIGIISLGHIGYKLLELLKNFDFKILVYSNHLTPEEAKELKVQKSGLEELMSQSDVVVLLAPNLPKYKQIINKNNLSLIKDCAIFINVARGALVNENDLVEELKRGRITAFLDVTEPEPSGDGHPFYTLPNCILTPHIAGSFGTECYRFGKTTLKEIKHYLKNEPIKSELTIDELDYRA